MTNLSNIGRAGPVAATNVGDSRPAPAALASATLAQAATRIATTLGAALRIPGAEQSEPWNGGSPNDAYGVEALGEELGNTLGGSPAERGAVVRALHAFVGEAAVLLAARPESGSLETVETAILSSDAAAPGRSDLDTAIAVIDRATTTIQGGQR